MKIVADDFEGGSTLQHGGGKFSTEEKNEYMESYYGIIDARKAGNTEKEKEYADKLLDSLRNYVKDEIADLADKEKETARLREEGFIQEVVKKPKNANLKLLRKRLKREDRFYKYYKNIYKTTLETKKA